MTMAAEIFGTQFILTLGKYRLRIACALEGGAIDDGTCDSPNAGTGTQSASSAALRVPSTWSLS
jgi:hypothetical protein